jgi:hypothetical protein
VKRLKAVVAVAAVLLATTACSSGASRFAIPSTDSGSMPSDEGSISGTSATGKISSVSQLVDTQACDLLTANEAVELGLPSVGAKNDAGAKSGCEWDGSEFVATVLIRTDVGLPGVVPDGATVTSLRAGRHDAKELDYPGDSGCMFVIGITGSVRVDIQAVPNTGSGRSQAQSLVQIIEPKLP